MICFISDEDDDDDVQVLDSDPEDSHVIHEISHDAESSMCSGTSPAKPKGESDSIDKIVAAAVQNLESETAADGTDNESAECDSARNSEVSEGTGNGQDKQQNDKNEKTEGDEDWTDRNKEAEDGVD